MKARELIKDQGSSPKLSPTGTQLYIMTDLLSDIQSGGGNGIHPENGQQKITKIIEEASEGMAPHHTAG